MIDYRTILENDLRRVGPAGFGFDQLARRRERKRRNERIRTVILALLLAAAAIGGAIRVIGNAERQLPANPVITKQNVQDLELAWSGTLDGAPSNRTWRAFGVVEGFPPTVAGGVVYVGTDTGKLYAFDAGCGTKGAACDPMWVGNAGSWISTSPTVADGTVYVTTQRGAVYAFPAECGTDGAACAPMWVGHALGPMERPVVSGGIVYGYDQGSGELHAFPVDCETAGAMCEPLWTARTEASTHPLFVGRGVPSAPTVADGTVYVVGSGEPPELSAFDALTGERLWVGVAATSPDSTPVVEDGLVLAASGPTLNAFAVGCRTDGGRCKPEWTFEPSDQFADYPLVVDGTVYLKSWSSTDLGHISAVDLHCGTGGATCQPLWTATDDGWGELVAGDGVVISTSNQGSGSFTVDAYPAACGTGGDICKAMWRATVAGPRTPVLAGGLVYIATAAGTMQAFPTSCGTGGDSCDPVWTAPGVDVQVSAPAIDGGRLFAASTDGTLYGFALPGSTEAQAEPTSSSAPTLVFYLGLAAAAAILLLVRARRRIRSRSSKG